jgi:hypothetical protein
MNSLGPIVRALLTLAAAAFPTATMLGVFAQHPDDTAKVLELFGNLASALWLYLRQPHPWLAGPVDDLKFWVKSFFRKRPTA